MELPLVHNPRARRGQGARLAAEAARLLAARGIATRPVATQRRGHATELVAALADAGAREVLVCGGDGTLSEAAAGALAARARPVLGLLPGGTGNSFLHGFGVRTLEDAVARIAERRLVRVDAARAKWQDGERAFINVFGTGFAAHVASLADRRLKLLGGAAYSAAVFPELARLRSPMTRLVLDDRVVEEHFALVAVCNTPHTGGRMLMAPMARSDDGLLEVVALRRVGRIGLMRLFPLIFDGTHIGRERVLHATTRRVRIEPAEPSALLADGEVLGSTPVEVECLPGALEMRL